MVNASYIISKKKILNPLPSPPPENQTNMLMIMIMIIMTQCSTRCHLVRRWHSSSSETTNMHGWQEGRDACMQASRVLIGRIDGRQIYAHATRMGGKKGSDGTNKLAQPIFPHPVPSIHLSIHLSVRTSVRPSVCTSACLSIYLSVCPPTPSAYLIH